MSAPLSRRAAIATFAALAVAVAVLLSLFVWPGPLTSSGCGPGGGQFEMLDGHGYCYTAVALNPHIGAVNETFRGYLFQVRGVANYGGQEVQANVTEPNGTTFTGVLSCLVGGCQVPTSLWITPDTRAGVTMDWSTDYASLLVEN